MALLLLEQYDSDSSEQHIDEEQDITTTTPAPLNDNQTRPPANKETTSSASGDAFSDDHKLPPELAAELRRAGHTPSQVSIVDVNATTNMRVANSNDHIPPSALRNTATRLAHQISKSRNVGRVARRKHQITALAADALALQAAQAVLPGSASRRKR